MSREVGVEGEDEGELLKIPSGRDFVSSEFSINEVSWEGCFCSWGGGRQSVVGGAAVAQGAFAGGAVAFLPLYPRS